MKVKRPHELKNKCLPIDREFKAITDGQERARKARVQPQLSIVAKPSTQKIIEFPKTGTE